MKRVLSPARVALVAGLFCLGGVSATAQLSSAIQTGERATRDAAQIQTQINQVDDARSEARREFRTLLQRVDAEKLFVLQQQRVVESQRRELASYEEQLERVDDIAAQMTPMMLDMIQDLENFVAADLPFKKELRDKRLADLRAAMDAPDVTPAEKYRLIISAYQQEMVYGDTIDQFTDTIDINGNPTKVTMFQYGRVALVYYNEANGNVARWNRDTGAWENLSGNYRREIQQAIRIAEGTAQKDVIFGPIQKFEVQASGQ